MKRLTLEEFESLLHCSANWKYIGPSDYRYNISSGHPSSYRDGFVKPALKEFDTAFYYRLCTKNKTPEEGRLWLSLLQYLYPPIPKPSTKERYFYKHLEKALNVIFRNFEKVTPYSRDEAIEKMPKNTSAGFTSLKYLNERLKKGECLPTIRRGYNDNLINVINGKPVDDYIMFYVRGQLHDRLNSKTRGIAGFSGAVTVAEGKYLLKFYEQWYRKPFFKNMWISGEGSLPALNRYILRNPDKYFYNLDIKGWDAYRASWFHDLMFKKLKEKLILNKYEHLEFKFIRDYAIRSPVILPDGERFRKQCGIMSGTLGTLLINSLLNTTACLCLLSMMGEIDLDWFDEGNKLGKVQDPSWLGDDFAFMYDTGSFPLDKFTSMYYKWFGCVISEEKTVITNNVNERKFLGYQLKGGFLYRKTEELFAALLYLERPMSKEYFFQISFSRFFSYLLLGGVNDFKFLEFFYYYCGRYKELIYSVDLLYKPGFDNIFKLLKDIYNVQIPSFSLETFKKMSTELMKYVLLYGYDLNFTDLLN